jgi:hypothetical protein
MPLIPTILIVLATFAVPDAAIAQSFIPCEGSECQACHFVELGNNVIKWLIGFVFLFFAILAVVAGIKLVTSGGNPSAKQAAKSSFTNAFIGLFIVLGAWLLIDTVFRGLIGGTGEIKGYGPWSEVQCGEGQVTSTAVDLGIKDLVIGDVIIRTTASGDNAAEFASGDIAKRIQDIKASGDVTALSDSALNSVGITDPLQRKAFRALISQESSNCKSKIGPDTGKGRGRAYGCIQMLVSTARETDAKLNGRFKGKTDAQVAEILKNDNAYNILLGATYFKEGLRKNNNDISLALARYNGGNGALENSTRCPGQRAYQCVANKGFQQTRNYVSNIKAIAAGL